MFNSFELCLIKYILDEYAKIIINNQYYKIKNYD